MTSRARHLRSVRARLVTAGTAVAAVLGAAGLALFTTMLHRGVNASVDAVLQSRAAGLVGALQASSGPDPALPAALVGPPTGRGAGSGRPGGARVDEGSPTLDSFTLVSRPDGTLVGASPANAGDRLLSPAELAAARTGRRAFTLSRRDEPLRVLEVPVARPDGTWVVAVGTSLAPATEAANRAIRDLHVAVPVLVVLAALGIWILAGAALRPVERMRADAEKLGEADPAGRIRVPGTGDELAHLADTFNAFLDRLHRSVRRQRDLVADTGHELRTPLAVLRTELELADGPDRTAADLADSLAHARDEVERLSKLAEDLLFLARADGVVPLVHIGSADLSAVLADTARANRARAETLGVLLVVDCPGPLVVRGDAAALRRAADNLVANALAATESGGRVELTASCGPGGTVVVVRDTGPGFPVGFLAEAFERFRRPDTARSSATGGAGLGLAIVAEIVRAHGGTVAAANRPEGGAAVTVTLPLGAGSGPDARGGGGPGSAPGQPRGRRNRTNRSPLRLVRSPTVSQPRCS